MELYEINSGIKSLYEMYEAGEIDEQAYKDTIESFGVENAVEEHIKMIRNAESNAARLREESDKLRQKAESETKKADFSKKIIIDCLETLGEKKLETSIFKVTKCVSRSADITDNALIPFEYYEVQPPKINKKAVLEDLRSGKEISGARLKESPYIRIT